MIKYYLWFVSMHTGYCGSDATDITLHTSLTSSNRSLESDVREMAFENASSYGYAEQDCGECEGCLEGDDCTDLQPSESIEGYAHLYVPSEHDCLRAGGGSFLLDEYPNAKYDTEAKAYYVI